MNYFEIQLIDTLRDIAKAIREVNNEDKKV